MNAKAKGSRAEHRSMRLFEAAASLGVFDIIAVGSKDVVLCQVKSNRWPDPAEMEAIRLFPCPANARKLVHRWIDRQRLPNVREVQ